MYDSFVASLFGFTSPTWVKDFSTRLDRLLKFYEILTGTSRWLVSQPKFAAVEAAFAGQNEQWSKLPEMKRVDFILWATGKAMKGDSNRTVNAETLDPSP